MMRRWLPALLVLGLLSACAPQPDAEDTPNPHPPVPALIPETMTKPPVIAEPLLWQPGHWDWTGSGYTWAPGQWVPAQGHGPLWMPGWWSHSSGGWVWQPPHWTS
jgi:hypothetical protein